MFSPDTISGIVEQLRQREQQVARDEEQLAASRAGLAEWSQLLSYAEANTTGLLGEGTPGGEQAEPPAPAGWCWCGLPGTPGMVHSLTSCVAGEADPTPTLQAPFGYPAFPDRAPFEPYTPADAGEQPAGGTQ